MHTNTWMAALGCAAALHAETPAVDGLFPAGAARRTTNLVTISGKFEPWPPKVWVDQPGLGFSAETNKGKFAVIIADTALPGPRLIRFYNEEGAGDPRIFVIGRGREIAEVEGNNQFSKPQWIEELPVTVNGRLAQRDDVDSFGVRLRQGQWLEARVDSYTLMSKLDAVLRLVTTNGQQLAWNHDFITLDPRLVWHAAQDDAVVLQIFGFPFPADSNVRLGGSESAFYRLHLAALDRPPELCEPPNEEEPNDSAATAHPIDLPGEVRGTISSPEDEDRFRFPAVSNQWVEAEVAAAALGSPLDAWLKIENEAGLQLARNDDAGGSPDPRLEWKAPTNGNFFLAVGSLTHRGGDGFHYRLSVRPVQPDFRAALAASSLVVTQAMTNDLKVTIKRLRGYTNELRAVFRDLPAGVRASRIKLEEKDGAATLSLAANDDAVPFQGPIALFLVDPSSQEERLVPFELTSRSENNGVPGGYTHLLIERADHLWLTVRAKPPDPPKPDCAHPD